MSVSSDTDGVAPLTNRVQVSAGACLVLATHNAGKLTELRQIPTPLTPGLVPESVISAASPQAFEPVEGGPSFVNNALLKARAPARAMSLPVVADDSGPYVDALGEASEIFSACQSGRHRDDIVNLQPLLDQLGNVADPRRGARPTCTVALVRPASGGQAEQVTTTECSMEGRLIYAPQGRGGFGYDPIFVPVQGDEPGGRGRTTAQMTSEEKHAISYRGQAFRTLAPVLAEVLIG